LANPWAIRLAIAGVVSVVEDHVARARKMTAATQQAQPHILAERVRKVWRMVVAPGAARNATNPGSPVDTRDVGFAVPGHERAQLEGSRWWGDLGSPAKVIACTAAQNGV